MVCVKCGRDNPGQPKFCAGCGAEQPAVTGSGGGGAYNVIADKVGLVPNLRAKDNLFQGAFVGVAVILGSGGAYLAEGSGQAALLGALGGLVGGALLSGLVLMIVGLFRKA